MKWTLLVFASLLMACEKEQPEEPPATVPVVIGTLRIVPVGNPTDSFRYQVGSSESIYFSYYSGNVSSSDIEFQIKSNSIYRVYYRDTTMNTESVEKFKRANTIWLLSVDTIGSDVIRSYHIQLHHQTGSSQENIIDTLPATVL